MSDAPSVARNSRFVGSIPEVYDRHLGPLLFEDYAADLARRVRLPAERPTAVLELAAGTGIFTARLLQRLPRSSTLVFTDVNEPMLDVARRRLATAPGVAAIASRRVDATQLPFGDGEFDAVACQFGVMFFPDKPRAAGEAFRVLRPGGQWIFSVWGSQAENRHTQIVDETVAGFFESDPPNFYSVPCGFHDERELRSLVLEAGFTEPEITTVDRTAEAPSAEHAAIGFVRGNPLLIPIEERATASVDTVVEAVARELAREFGDHPLRMPMRVRVVSTRRPD